MSTDDRPISELFRLASKQWVELDAAANLLEETKSSVLSERMAALGDMPVSRAEMTVKASKEWRDFLEAMVNARKSANLAKVRVDWIRMRAQEAMSREATARLEARL